MSAMRNLLSLSFAAGLSLALLGCQSPSRPRSNSP